MISTTPLTGIAVLAAFALSAGAAQAQGTPEQRAACTPDAIRLCQDTIPDVDRTTACMSAHRSELSARCQAVFDAPAKPTHIARTPPQHMARPKPAPHVVVRLPMPAPMHHHVAAAAPEHPRTHRTTLVRTDHLHGDRDTRAARRVIGNLCGARVLDASTCGFMGKVLTLAE